MKRKASLSERVLESVDEEDFRKVVRVLLHAARRRGFFATCPVCGTEAPGVFKVHDGREGPYATCFACDDEQVTFDVIDLVMRSRDIPQGEAALWLCEILGIPDTAASDNEDTPPLGLPKVPATTK